MTLNADAVAAHAACLPALASKLEALGFTADAVLGFAEARSFSELPRAAVKEELATREASPLVALLVRGDVRPRGEIAALVGDDLELLLELGVLEAVDAGVRAAIAVLPIRSRGASVWVAHDRYDAALEAWAVMPPDESSEMIDLAAPTAAANWLDLGAGSGVLGLLAARRGSARVVSADLNRRSPAFVALGAALSGLTLETCVSDLFAEVPRVAGGFDVITFGVPWLYDSSPVRWQSAPEGPAFLERLLRELDDRLATHDDAEAVFYLQLPFDPMLLAEKLPGLDLPRFRALSLRLLSADETAAGLLWIGRSRERAWYAESFFDLDGKDPFIERHRLEEKIAKLERE